MLTEPKSSKAKKLQLADAEEIRRWAGEGVTQGALARHFGVTVGTIGRIVRGETWQTGAGRNVLTPEKADDMLKRLKEVQKRKDSGMLLEPPAQKDDFMADSQTPLYRAPLEEEIAARAAAYGAEHVRERVMPPGLLEGGDPLEEREGTGLGKLVQEASKTPEMIEKLLKGDLP